LLFDRKALSVGRSFHSLGFSTIGNLANQRTRQTRTDGSYVDYTYDNIGQLVSAIGKESGGAARLHENFGYLYDAAGNLSHRTNNALVQTFSVNTMNEITGVSRANTLTVAGTTTSPATSVTVNGLAASCAPLSLRSGVAEANSCCLEGCDFRYR
jgi:hypothetical protein